MWQRTSSLECHSHINFLTITGVDGVQHFLRGRPVLQQLFTESPDAVAATCRFFLILCTVAVGIISLVVPVVTVGHTFNQGGAMARAGAVYGGNGGLPDGDDVLAVHGYAGHVVGRGAIGNPRNGKSVLNWR